MDFASAGAARWHVPHQALAAWVEGTCSPVQGASVEQHVVRCDACQASVADLLPGDPLAGWDAVLAAVEVPQPSPIERWLLRLGMSEADTVVLVTAPRVLAAWYAALVALLTFTFVARDVGGQDGALVSFLLLAPILPVAGVALAYGPGADPSYETVLASPYRMFRLVLLRSAAVLAVSLPIIAIVGVLLPIATAVAAAWLLPALGFTLATLAASTWVRVELAGLVIGAGWFLAICWTVWVHHPLVLVAPLSLVGYAVLLAAAAAALAGRMLEPSTSNRLS